jgi:hypothetical protein
MAREEREKRRNIKPPVLIFIVFVCTLFFTAWDFFKKKNPFNGLKELVHTRQE